MGFVYNIIDMRSESNSGVEPKAQIFKFISLH